MRWLCALLLLYGGLALQTARLALAQPAEGAGGEPEVAPGSGQPGDEKEAQRLFERGNRDLERAARARGLRKEQLLQKAMESYGKCMKLVRNPNLIFNLALALEQLGRFREAFDRYTEYLLFAELTGQEREEGSTRRDGLLPKLAVIRVQSEPPGATVRVDGSAQAVAGVTPLEIAVDEGEHRVLVSRQGYQERDVSVRARVGERMPVTAVLERLVTEPSEPSVPVEPEPEPEPEELPVEELPETAAAVVSSNVAATVLVDGKAAGEGSRVKLDLSPGPHLVRVQSEGYRPAQLRVRFEPGQSSELNAALAPEPGRRMGAWPAVTWVATGVAGAAWAVLGIRALSLNGDYEQADVQERLQDKYDQVEQANLIADVALVATAALGTTALVLTLLDGPEEQAPSRLSIQVGALDRGVGLAAFGSVAGP